MKRTIKELKGFTIHAKDGTKGTVKDFLFDEESWTIRYMVADLGNFLPGRKVLIPRVFLEDTDWVKGTFSVALSKDQIKNCPELSEHIPVSREYEAKLYDHYDLEYYWPVAYSAPLGTSAAIKPPNPVHLNLDIIKDDDIESNLRSFNEVKGYRLECLDKKKGHLKNFIIDDETWQIAYMVVDIGHWYTRSKKVMLSAEWMHQINYINQTVHVDLNSETLENAPEFDPSQPVNVKYEQQLFDYYGRRTVHA